MVLIGASRFGERALFRVHVDADASATRAHADRRRGPLGPQPAPRAARDAGRAGRRLRRRRPAPLSAGACSASPSAAGRSTSSGSSSRPSPTRCSSRSRTRPPTGSTPSSAPAPPPPSPAASFAARPTSTPSPCSAPLEYGQPPPTPSRDRFYRAIPLAAAFLWLASCTAGRPAATSLPWLFTDELKYTQIARGIADTGPPPQRAPPGALRLPLHLLHRAVLVDRRRPHRLRGDQVRRRRSR